MNDQSTTTPGKINRRSIRVPAEPLRLWLKDNDKHETAEALGVNASSMMQWIKFGSMPKAILVALEALKRRQGAGPRSHTYVITVPSSKLEAFKQFANALDLRLNNISIPE